MNIARKKQNKKQKIKTPFGGDFVRHFKKSPCSRVQCATCTVSRADALWQEATEAGAGASLLVLFQMNTLGLVLVVLPSYSELFALRKVTTSACH